MSVTPAEMRPFGLEVARLYEAGAPAENARAHAALLPPPPPGELTADPTEAHAVLLSLTPQGRFAYATRALEHGLAAQAQAQLGSRVGSVGGKARKVGRRTDPRSTNMVLGMVAKRGRGRLSGVGGGRPEPGYLLAITGRVGNNPTSETLPTGTGFGTFMVVTVEWYWTLFETPSGKVLHGPGPLTGGDLPEMINLKTLRDRGAGLNRLVGFVSGEIEKWIEQGEFMDDRIVPGIPVYIELAIPKSLEGPSGSVGGHRLARPAKKPAKKKGCGCGG